MICRVLDQTMLVYNPLYSSEQAQDSSTLNISVLPPRKQRSQSFKLGLGPGCLSPGFDLCLASCKMQT